jgi:DNA-binding MarR family transcriptional regulator
VKTTRAKISAKTEKMTPVPAGEAVSNVELGRLTELVGYQIRRANGRSVMLWEDLLSGRGVAWGHYSILKIISLNPGLIQKEVAAAAGVDQTTVVPIINHLEKSGLVERTRDPKDGRNVIVRVTAPGWKLLRRVDSLVEVHDRELTRSLSSEDRATLLRLLSAISALPVH